MVTLQPAFSSTDMRNPSHKPSETTIATAASPAALFPRILVSDIVSDASKLFILVSLVTYQQLILSNVLGFSMKE